MYKIGKGRGSTANVTVINTDTGANIIIGAPSIRILETLKKDGYSTTATGEKKLDMHADWDFEVSEEVAKDLARYTLAMKKPPRERKKTEQDAKPAKDKKQPVDVFNMIFGVED